MKELNEVRLDRGWQDWLDYLDQRLKGVETGDEALDRYLLGLGGVTVIQGSTGSCKSTWALQIVHHGLKRGMPCVMLDRENGVNRVKNRLICQAGSVSENDIKVLRGRGEIGELKRLKNLVRSHPLFIYTDSPTSTELIKARVEQMIREGGVDGAPAEHAFLLVDSVQAMPSLDPDRAKSIEAWMGFFDQLKLDFEGKLTILVTSEINRASYKEDAGVGAGKGSNAIEYKTETLLDVRPTDDPDVLKVLVAKHRDGQKGAIFMLEKCFSDYENKASFTFVLKARSEETAI